MFRKAGFLLLAITLFVPSAIVGQSNNLKINHKEYKLKNGLTVVLHEDKSTPIVSVNVFYHVGSKNETAGKTGFAHLFEHMMFQGSKNYNGAYSTSIADLGARYDAYTTYDQTFYFESVPSNYLERALFLESDRMSRLLEAVTQEKLDIERDVVKNERRQRIDNQPYGTARERIGNIMYPEEHPYHWSVLGSLTDLSAASLDDVKGFFRQYYVPNNTVLVIAGDYDERQARAWIKKYFGSIAEGQDITRPKNPQPKLNGEIRKTYEDAVSVPRLYMVWQGVPQYFQDEAALDMLASILSIGRGSRPQSNLVYGKEIAQSVFVANETEEIGGLFRLSAIAKSGKTPDEIEKEINTEIERIKKEPPTAEEMTRALNIRESEFVYGLQSVLGKGEQLSRYTGFLGKPDYFQTDLDRYRKVRAADVQRVAGQYLSANRLVMNYIPHSGSSQIPALTTDKSAATKAKGIDTALLARQKAALPKAGTPVKFALPAIEKTKFPNGLNVWIVKNDELPIVSMNLVLNAGATQDSAEKIGAASMTAGMLDQGTATRSAIDIANQQQSIGATIGTGTDWDSTSISLQTLTKNLDPALEIYADVITNPAFPVKELESLSRRRLDNIAQGKTVSFIVSSLAFNKVLYGSQIYGRNLDGDEKSIKAMTRDDLVNFYKANYSPNNAKLIVVGDVSKETLLPKLEKAFANWKGGAAAARTKSPQIITNSPQTMTSKPGIYIINKPGAAQSSVSVGQVGIDRSNPDYYAVQVMNDILGNFVSGRLNRNLREDKGYTYFISSSFTTGRAAGPFRAYGDFQTFSTKESVSELMKEISGMRGAIPITPEEFETHKRSIINGYPQGFETVGQVSAQLSNLFVYGLPDTYFNDYITKINAVTIADVNRVANKYLTPDRMAIVIVSDKAVIESKLRELNYPIMFLDVDGNPIDH